MKILVTGGAGFIGSHLVEALVEEGHGVRVLDDFSTGRVENLHAVLADVELLEGDCADPERAAAAVRGVEAVFHQAALPSVARSVADPLPTHRAGPTATLTMLVAARDEGVARFVYAGSSSVYGDTPTLPKREDMETHPLSPYAAGKLLGEHYARLFARLYGMETLTLRYFNVFGPRQDGTSPYSGVISRFVEVLLAGGIPVVHGDGRQSRDFTYVANAVAANLLALHAVGLAGQAVNVATGRRVSLLELLETLARLTGRPAAAQQAPPRAGDVRHSRADLGRAREVLGYAPAVDFEEGLRRTVAWLRERRQSSSSGAEEAGESRSCAAD
ncbi:MAG: NAD-dependent epimerase/dehydratase family protein [Acidobacteria bacterium]|nr:NAD-dependent epimerase/dehydratase family protein [Acidobacteriota bacterium]